MSFSQIDAKLEEVKTEIKEINKIIKQLVIQMQLMNLNFERILKPQQKKEHKPLEIKFSEKITPKSDDEKYIRRCQERFLKINEETPQQIIEGRQEETL